MSDLPAGRELDALVAEKVMGWTSVRRETTHYPNAGMPVDVVEWVGRPPGADRDDYPPDYSTSIADAWLVIERLRVVKYDATTERGGTDRFHLRHFLDVGGPGPSWSCDFMTPLHGGWTETYATADTAPLAICRAALKAVAAD